MSFRARIAIAAAGAVALAVVLASILVFFVVRGELRAQIDETLEQRAREIASTRLAEIPSRSGESFLAIPPGFGEPNTYVQLVRSDGTTLRQPYEDFDLPVPDDVLVLAQSVRDAEAIFSDTEVSGQHVRVYSFAYGPGYAVQVARPVAETDEALAQIRLYLVLVALTGIGLAAAFGLVVARAALAPVRQLTRAAERVSETGDLSERIEVGGRDELSRLAASFNTMLAALEDSTRAQRRLVADASHELRTPLTSLRTNIEVLASDHTLPAEDRSRLLSDVVEQLGEMTTLIAELIELARAEQHTSDPEAVRLDLVAADTIERARRNRPGVTFSASLEESVVHGVPATLERAIGNLLDNAAKWSPPGAEIEIEVRDGLVAVRDHGPGSQTKIFRTSSTASTGQGWPEGCPGRVSASRSFARWQRRTAAKSSPNGPRGGGTRMILRLGRLSVAVRVGSERCLDS